ncbi:MAG: hypothetical protein AAF719_13005 [Pseudomonadota bacterium]
MSETADIWTFDDAQVSVWRNAPELWGRKTAAVGGFCCETAEAGSAALIETTLRLREEGFDAVLGPMDGDTWGAHRLVVESDGRPPFLMEPRNPDHYPDAFNRAEFEIVGRYISADRPAASPLSETPPAPGVKLRNLDLNAFETELTRIFDLSLETFAQNAFYKPIERDAFLASYAPVKGFVDPDLVFLAEDEEGRLKGFLFGIPNFAEGPETKTAILKTYASAAKGVGSMLANAFHERVRDKGFTNVIHALMHADNLSASHSANTGGGVFRRYALWGKML